LAVRQKAVSVQFSLVQFSYVALYAFLRFINW